MKQYLDLVKEILEEGVLKGNRTGIDTLFIPSAYFKHDMSKGFPLLTTKFVSLKTVAVELEGFIQGVTSKSWFQERKCHIWDEWCNPQKVPYSNDEETKQKMKEEDDLGFVYGSQWRDFKDPEVHYKQGRDQFKELIDTLKKNPFDRRMICMAWNPLALEHQALPPCHFGFHVVSDGKKVHLSWFQRSQDVGLGAGYNIASYALLLKLIAKEVGMEEGILTGHIDDAHIYSNHIEPLKTQLQREPLPLCTVDIPNFSSIFSWTHKDLFINNYTHHGKISMPVAV
jgi:thymidylate synthase